MPDRQIRWTRHTHQGVEYESDAGHTIMRFDNARPTPWRLDAPASELPLPMHRATRFYRTLREAQTAAVTGAPCRCQWCPPEASDV